MKLSARQAIVKTAQVEIKTLSVSGKQVTLAVFRQLDQSPLIDYANNCLNGIAWGRVNYHPDGCKNDFEHLHVVWQKDTSIYRDYIPFNFSDEKLVKMDVDLKQIATKLWKTKEFYELPFEQPVLIKEYKTFQSMGRYLNRADAIVAEKNFYELYDNYLDYLGIREAFHDELYLTLEQLDLLFIAV